MRPLGPRKAAAAAPRTQQAAAMARKKIREYDAKRLLKLHLQRLALKSLPIQVAQVNASTDIPALLHANPWLVSSKLVVKPDMLFGQRGKHDLVGLNLDWPAAEAFIKARLGKVVTVKGCSGPVTTFIVEPFVPHAEEYYLCIQVGTPTIAPVDTRSKHSPALHQQQDVNVNSFARDAIWRVGLPGVVCRACRAPCPPQAGRGRLQLCTTLARRAPHGVHACTRAEQPAGLHHQLLAAGRHGRGGALGPGADHPPGRGRLAHVRQGGAAHRRHPRGGQAPHRVLHHRRVPGKGARTS